MKCLFFSVFLTAAAASAQNLYFQSTLMSAGNAPIAVRVADFNGDRLPDIAVINSGGSGTVTVLLNAGAGSFSGPIASTTGGLGAWAMTVGDFNHDGKADLAVVNNVTNNVSILLGRGDGTFRTGSFAPAHQGPVAITEGDFNRDGNLDLAVVNSISGDVTILLGRRNGAFQPGTPVFIGSAPTNIRAGDFNGDGILDLAVTNGTLGQHLVYLLLGNGDGTFRNAGTMTVGYEPFAIIANDLNHDGGADLVVADLVSNEISVLLGNGDGSFRTAVNYPAGNGPVAVRAGHFAGSGNLDLAVCADVSAQVLVYPGNGDGTFRSPLPQPTGSPCNSLAVGDLYQTGRTDIVAATANGLVLFHKTSQ
ncbi:MAG TPA: VCBS repeat-containing protein [Bryobacteraceae bacterium]|nr:VCBS repeat-containing protein [Bryobacteraceae bacterium]